MKGWTHNKEAYENYNIRLWINNRTGKILEIRFVPPEEFMGYKYIVHFPTGAKIEKCRTLSEAMKLANDYMKKNK